VGDGRHPGSASEAPHRAGVLPRPALASGSSGAAVPVPLSEYYARSPPGFPGVGSAAAAAATPLSAADPWSAVLESMRATARQAALAASGGGGVSGGAAYPQRWRMLDAYPLAAYPSSALSSGMLGPAAEGAPASLRHGGPSAGGGDGGVYSGAKRHRTHAGAHEQPASGVQPEALDEGRGGAPSHGAPVPSSVPARTLHTGGGDEASAPGYRWALGHAQAAGLPEGPEHVKRPRTSEGAAEE
jgi:hypothetical protein